MKWYKLNNYGEIVETVEAPDKATATRIFRGGPVVSALSYEVKRIKTNARRRPIRQSRYPSLPAGHLFSPQAAASLNLSRQRFLEITRVLGLTPTRFARINGARQIFAWTPDDIALVAHYHASRFSPARLAAAAAKRRASLLLHHAERYRQTRLARQQETP